MGKIMRTGKVVIVLGGRYAGRKGIILKALDEGTADKPYPQALIAGIERYPRRVTRRMNKAKVQKNCRIKPFIKVFSIGSRSIKLFFPKYLLFSVHQLLSLVADSLFDSRDERSIEIQHQGLQRSSQT